MPEDITQSKQYEIVKNVIGSDIERNLLKEYENIKSLRDNTLAYMNEIQNLSNSFTRSTDFSADVTLFTENMSDYMPELLNSVVDGPNEFVQSLVYQVENFNLENLNLDINNVVNTIVDGGIDSLTSLPNTMVQMMGSDIINGTFNNIVNSFSGGEFNVGRMLSECQNMLNIGDFAGSVQNVLNMSETLLTNFGDVVNVENIQNMVENVQDFATDMFTDLKGSINMENMLQTIGSFAPADIQNILQTVQPLQVAMNNVVSMISTNNFEGALGALACNVSSLVNKPQIANAANKIIDTANNIQNTEAQLSDMISTIQQIKTDNGI